MSTLVAMYGKLEGVDGRKFAREVSGFMGLEAGIYKKFGIDLSWQHVQRTEESQGQGGKTRRLLR